MADARNDNKEAIRALEFYSGIGTYAYASVRRVLLTIFIRPVVGGLHLALSRSKIFGTVASAFDWDQAACQVYKANHGPNIVHQVRRITKSIYANSNSLSLHLK